MASSVRSLGVAAAVALVGLAPGCGGDNQFVAKYNVQARAVTAVGNDIGKEIQGAANKGDADLSKGFVRLADRTMQARAGLVALDPPDRAKAHFEDLLAALASGEKHLRDVARAIRASDVDAIQKSLQELQADGQAIDRASRAVKKDVNG